MFELKREGLYIAQGPKTNVLIRVVGEYPLLSILGGVSLNELYATGKAKTLTDKSPEIQDILVNPRKYTFELPTVTEAVTNEKGLELETKPIENIETMVERWKEDYASNMELYGNTIKLALRIVSEGYTVSQANGIIKQIELRRRFGTI